MTRCDFQLPFAHDLHRVDDEDDLCVLDREDHPTEDGDLLHAVRRLDGTWLRWRYECGEADEGGCEDIEDGCEDYISRYEPALR